MEKGQKEGFLRSKRSKITLGKEKERENSKSKEKERERRRKEKNNCYTLSFCITTLVMVLATA